MSLRSRLDSLQPADIGIPGPTSLQMAAAFRSVRHDPLTFLSEVSATFGNTVAFPVPGTPTLLLNNPYDVRQVLQTSARNWTKQTIQYAALARVTGPGLLASSEPNWIAHRRTAAPAFHHHRLLAVSEQVGRAADSHLSAELDALPSHGAVIDLSRLMHRIALDAVGRALFSANLSEHSTQLLSATSNTAMLVVRLGRSILPTNSWLPTRTNVRLRRARRRLDAITFALIAERRRAMSDTHGDDLLGLLLDSPLRDEEIRDELVTMVIAGHETVAAALTWTLMLLAEHPEIQHRLRTEIAARRTTVSMLDHHDQLPYTRAVIDESLRLYPPAWAISRRSLHPETIGGTSLPAGTMVIISPWLLHRRDEEWPDPLRFQPDRFTGAPASPTGYLPFGQGPRLCIGRQFALGEMAIIMHKLLARYRLQLPTGWSRPEAQALVAVHPRGGLALHVIPHEAHDDG